MQPELFQDDTPSDAVQDVRRHVLVVEDSAFQRRILGALLANWGYKVSEAASGAEALEFCRSRMPDLVISDWVMPGMDGLEFCRAFRALDRGAYGYFILLTSRTEKERVAEGLNSGADDFLCKPVDPIELRARLNAGARILMMQRELFDRNRQLGVALGELQQVHDLIDSDLVEARKLQQSLVRERYRDFGAAQVSLMLSPAGRVGGDLVGFFPASEGQIGLYAIDVAGHGISSALMTARLAGHLSASLPEQNLALRRDAAGAVRPVPPAEVAKRLNAILLEEVGGDHYLTLVLANCDLATGRVTLVQAGHPHPLVQRKAGGVEEVGAGGMPVGLLPQATFEEVEVWMRPGDRLLILSDGVIECPDRNGGILGEEGLKTLLAAMEDLRGPALLEGLLWALAEVNPLPDFPDDISGVSFEFRGKAGITVR